MSIAMTPKNKILENLVFELVNNIQETLIDKYDIMSGRFYEHTNNDVVEVNCHFENGKITSIEVQEILTSRNKPATNLRDYFNKIFNDQKCINYINQY
jgi:hypothetical protein